MTYRIRLTDEEAKILNLPIKNRSGYGSPRYRVSKENYFFILNKRVEESKFHVTQKKYDRNNKLISTTKKLRGKVKFIDYTL